MAASDGTTRPTPPPAQLAEQLVENILYAAAEAVNMSPQAIRPAVRAAFARAKQLAVEVSAVDGVLTPTESPAPARPPGAASRKKG